MRSLAALTLAFLVASLLSAQGGGDKKTDAERFRGTWRLTGMSVDAEAVQPEVLAIMRLTFHKDDKLDFLIAVVTSACKYKVVGPGQVDLTLFGSKDAQLGIYKFDDDNRLTICLGVLDKRPTEFKATKTKTLLTMTRVKPGDEKPTLEEIKNSEKAMAGMREKALFVTNLNNLKHIGLGMMIFHDTHQHLPTHAIYGKDGKTPLLSWRVALLPFIEQVDLYKLFKLDESWDSTHNKQLIAKMPDVYRHPMGNDDTGLTHYQVFTGPGTVFDGPNKIKYSDLRRGWANTAIVTEAKEAVIWTKPADLVLPQDKDKMPALGGLDKNGFHIVMCDGIVVFLRRQPPPAVFRALISPQGGEIVDLDKYTK